MLATAALSDDSEPEDSVAEGLSESEPEELSLSLLLLEELEPVLLLPEPVWVPVTPETLTPVGTAPTQSQYASKGVRIVVTYQ